MESGGFCWTQSRWTLVESGGFCQTPWTLADSGGLDIQSWPMSHQHNPGLESAGVWRNPLESAGVGGGVYSPHSCAAKASSLFRNRAFILSSIAGYFVLSYDNGIATGDSPNINSNGVCCLSACRRLLCVNSNVCKACGHSSGWEAQ